MNLWGDWNKVKEARGASAKLFKRNSRCNCRRCEGKGKLVIFDNLQQLRQHMRREH